MYMLDTDICIYIIKGKPAGVSKRFQRLQPGDLAMSAITFAELMNGAMKSRQVKENVAKLNEMAELLESWHSTEGQRLFMERFAPIWEKGAKSSEATIC